LNGYRRSLRPSAGPKSKNKPRGGGKARTAELTIEEPDDGAVHFRDVETFGQNAVPL
jgi:hypothetical protein